MRYFLGLQPPAFLADSVLRFREKWGVEGVEPHITVKAPCGLGNFETWLETVQQVCQTQPGFSVSVEGVESFSSTAVYLRVKSPNLISFHQRLIRALGISEADQRLCFEGVRYIPHLSIVHLKPAVPIIPRVFIELLASASVTFKKQVVFQPDVLVVYQKEEASEYRPVSEISLGMK